MEVDAIWTKIRLLDDSILEHQINLRELEVEKSAYQNAIRLLKGGSIENDEDEPPEVDETPFSQNGQMYKVRELLRGLEKRPYHLKEISTLMNLDDKQARILGVVIAGEAKKERCFMRFKGRKGMYGLKEYKNHYKDLLEDSSMQGGSTQKKNQGSS